MTDDRCKDELFIYSNKTPTDYSNTPWKDEWEIWKKFDYTTYMMLFACIVIILGGLLGNASIILTVTLNKCMKTTINLYIANLAVTDSLICLVCMVPLAFKTTTSNEIYMLGEFMCKFNPFTQMSCLTCSVLTLSAISCDRFMAIIFPLRTRVTKQRPGIVMAIIWIISILVSTPFIIVKKYDVRVWSNFSEPRCMEQWTPEMYYGETHNKCILYFPLQQMYYVVVSITLFFLPVFIMITAYSFILWRIWISRVPGEHHEGNVNIQSRSRRKVNKMVFVVLIVFIICWLPFQVIILFSAFGHKPELHGQLPTWFIPATTFSYFIAYANSFLNPIIYGGFNKKFREGFSNLLRCKYLTDQYGRSVFSRRTFTSGLKSSSSRNASKTLNGSKKAPPTEMKPMPPAAHADVSPVTKDTIPNIKIKK